MAVATLWLLPWLAGAGLPPLTSYTSVEVGSPTETRQIVQDRQGQLYFAGRSLLTFDGERWDSHPLTTGYLMRSVEFGPDGRIWAASAADLGWFERTADLRWKYQSLRQHVPAEHAAFGEVWKVFADDNGATFVTENRIFRWDGNAFQIWHLPGTRRLYASKAGDVSLVHYTPVGLYAVSANGLQLLIPREILGESAVIWAEKNQHGWLFGTSRGFFQYDGQKMTPFAPEISPFVQEHKLTCAVRMPDGRIAIGTLDGGVAFVNASGQPAGQLGSKEGLWSLRITSLFVDRDHQLWVTTPSQIIRADLSAQSLIFDERAGLPRTPVQLVAALGEHVALSNESGIYGKSESIADFKLIKGMVPGAKTILPIPDGFLVSGYHGVMRWDGHTAKQIYSTTFDSFAVLPLRREPHKILITDNRQVVESKPDGTVVPIARNLPAPAVSLAEDADSRVWIGSFDQGLRVSTPAPDQTKRVDGEPEFGLPKLTGFVHLRSTSAGDVFVFADEGAWALPAGTKRFEAVRDFPIGAVTAFSVTAKDDSVWVLDASTHGSFVGVLRISLTNGKPIAESLWVDALSVIGTPECIFADTAHSANGSTTLWIGGSKGLLRHVVAQTSGDFSPRQPLLRAFARIGVENRRQSISATLPYDTRSLDFEFASLEYSRRARIRLESRIDGIDVDWIRAGANPSRELSGIREGKYTVRVRAVAPTGVVSSEATLTFEVLPPWWRTRTALTLEALGILVVVFGGYRYRVRSLHRQNAMLEAKVRERTEELERASAAKTEFVANMSHDIRNPLNGIVGLALALEDTRLDSRQQEIVATLRECTTYLSSLVDDVLDFASIEAGKVDLRPGAFSPADLLQSIVTTLKADTAERGAILRIDCDATLPAALMGDAGRIQQILVNYVSNALKYAGGEIRLSAKIPAKSPGEIEFSVADRGPGITREEQAVLFTKFSRLAGARRDDIPGAGLGLAACRHLADLMGGSVGVVSEMGAGSRFFLRLPLAVAQEQAPANTATLPNTAVLLVEDTDYNAWAASAVLAKLGLTCDRARNGEEAVRMFGERRYNVVLLDRNLPDMDGTEVARRLRTMETEGASAGSPAILLAVTAYCTAEDKQKCIEAGMDAFVGKPLTPEKLKRVLVAAGRRLLSSATLQAEPETAASSTNALDTSLLSYLADEEDPAGFNIQLDRFLAHLEETTAELRQASAAQDHDTLATAAHRVLGQARMIGCAALESVAASLEAAARAGNAVACGDLVQRVQAEIAALREALRRRTTSAQPA